MNAGWYWPNATCFTNGTFIIKYLRFYVRSYRVTLPPDEKTRAESLTPRHSSSWQTGPGVPWQSRLVHPGRRGLGRRGPSPALSQPSPAHILEVPAVVVVVFQPLEDSFINKIQISVLTFALLKSCLLRSSQRRRKDPAFQIHPSRKGPGGSPLPNRPSAFPRAAETP